MSHTSKHEGLENEQLEAAGQALSAPNWLSADAFRLATLGGAEALHRSHELGTLEIGKLADLNIFDADSSFNLAGAADPFQAIVFWAGAEDVGGVMIGGEWVKRDGEFVNVEWKDVRREFVEGARSVQRKLEEFLNANN